MTLEGHSPAQAAAMLAGVSDGPASLAPLEEWKRRTEISEEGAFERAVLALAAEETAASIRRLTVPDSVKTLLEEEFRYYTKPTGPKLTLGKYEFAAAAKVISLRRFPAGPMDWEPGGFPRRWLAQVPPGDLPRFLWFLWRRFGGFQPAFFMHVARRPKNRSLVLEKEVLKSYWRMARAIEMQPQTKGLVASGWFHDPAAVRDNPHLEPLNRPYREGGCIVTTGPAPEDAGFLEHNATRKQQLESGDLRYRLGVALWPRAAAIAWANAHPELAS